MAKDNLRSQTNIAFVDLLCEGEIEGLVNGAKSIYLNNTQLQNDSGTFNFDGVTFEEKFGTNNQSALSLINGVENEISVNTQVTKIGGAITRTITNADVSKVRIKVRVPALFEQADNGDVNGTTVRIKAEVQSNGGGYKSCIIGGEYLTTGVTNVTSLHEQCSNASTRIKATVVLTGEYAGSDDNGTYYHSFTYQLQYRAIGAATWVIGKTVSHNTLYGSCDDQITIENLIANTYEVKVVVTASGGGTPASVTGTLNCQFYQGVAYDDIIGKASDGYERDYEIPLYGSAPWGIRIIRETNDSTDLKLQNDTYWASYTEIITQKFKYPNSALIGIKYDSSEFSSTPVRGYDVKLKKIQIPSNYDPIRKLYRGIWDGTFQTAWSDNPAWCFYDLLTNTRYGLGNYISSSQIDKWTLYTIAQYCDELVDNGDGGTEPRFTCNLYIQSREEAFKVLNDFASIFRSMIYWSNGTITFGQDAPKDAVALFSPANVIGGQFNYSGSSAKTRYTVALVTWNDPDDFYKQKVEYVEDKTGIARYGVLESEVTAIGCTSRGQARRVGKWLLYSNQYENETVTFTTGLDGLTIRPNDIIKVQDPTRGGARYSGRVSSATTTAITIDSDFTLPASSTMFVVLTDGTVESKAISSKSGTVITLASALSSAPQSGAVWMISAPIVELQSFRVISASESDGNNVAITAIKHDSAKYAYIEDGEKLPVRDYTNISVVPTAPTIISTSEDLYTYQSEVRSKLTITYDKGINAAEYRIDYRKDSNNWIKLMTSGTDVEVLNTTPGSYEIRVWSINALGKQSATYATTTVSVLGKTAPPSNVAGFTYSLDPNIGVTLSWTDVTDLDLAYYEIRKGASWDTATFVARTKASYYKVGGTRQGSETYLIKALDTSEIYSATAASLIVAISAPPVIVLASGFEVNTLSLTWSAVEGSFATASYEIRYGNTWATATSLGKVNTTYFRTKINWAGARTFFVAAIDIAGNYGTVGSTVITVALPSNISTINYAFADSSLTNATATLSWTSVSPVHGLGYYELTYDSVVTNVNSNNVIVPANWVGNKTFTVKVVDLVGNKSTGTSVVAVKSLPNAPTAPATTVSQGILALSWTAPIKTSLPIWGYEVRTDTNFGTAGFIFKGTASNCTIPNTNMVLGANSYYIKTIDTDNNYSSAFLTASYTVLAPNNILDFTTDFADSSLTSATVTLKWVDAVSTFGIDSYKITYNSTTYTTKGNSITLPADWVGNRTYVVKTIDNLGNESSGYSESVTKLAPNAPTNFRAQIIDNNVLFYWDLPTRTTLPISHVLLKKGATWATATIIGTKSGAFTSISETQGGDYVYWIATVDTDDIESTPISLSATVAEPPDFIFNGEFISAFGGTKSSAIAEEGQVIIPVNTTETWADHFTTRAWTSPQDQINAGFPIYIQPTTSTGYYEEVFDYGNILASSKITIDYSGTSIAGTPTLASTISISVDGVTYTDYAGVTSIYGSNFRYVKVRVTVNQTGTNAIYRLETLNARLDAKQINDSGSQACLSTDANGTIANFNKEFVDITSINVTPSGTTSTTAVYDFQDAILNSTYSLTSNVCTVTATAHGLITGQNVRLYFSSGTAPSGVYTVTGYTANTFTVSITTGNTSGNCLTYPQGFRIYLFNSSGTRVSGTASWAVRGY